MKLSGIEYSEHETEMGKKIYATLRIGSTVQVNYPACNDEHVINTAKEKLARNVESYLFGTLSNEITNKFEEFEHTFFLEQNVYYNNDLLKRFEELKNALRPILNIY